MHENPNEHDHPLCVQMQVLRLVESEDGCRGHVFLYDAESRERLLMLLQEYVADPDYEFSQAKADLISDKVQKIAKDEERQRAERSRQDLE